MDNFFRADLLCNLRRRRSRTPTISRGTFVRLISLLAFAAAQHATACSLALQLGANMAPNAAELSNADRVKLARLALDARALPVRDVTAVIYAYADPAERNASRLVERRARGAKDFLIQLGVSPQRIEVDQRVRRSRRSEDVEMRRSSLSLFRSVHRKAATRFAPRRRSRGRGIKHASPSPRIRVERRCIQGGAAP